MLLVIHFFQWVKAWSWTCYNGLVGAGVGAV